MKRTRIAFLAVTLLVGVARPPIASSLEERSPLVFVHGIKGATLVDEDGATCWLGAWQALGLSSPKLALAARWEQEGSQPFDELSAGEVLRSVRLIPGLLEFPVYGRWLSAAAVSGRALHPFAYDWRRELGESVVGLERFVERTAASSPTRKVLLVAHSMGGLLAFSLLNRRPELFSGAVFAGVPFDGGIGFLPDLQEGVKNGLNGRILAPEVLATFPSVYTLFPDDTEALVGAGGDGKRVTLRDVATWKRLQLGPFAPGRQPTPELERFLEEAFRRARVFRQGLVPRLPSYPPILTVVATHRPTLASARKDGPKAALGWDFASEAREPGDGRVRAASMRPPAGVPCDVVVSPRDHAELLDDGEVQRRIFAMP